MVLSVALSENVGSWKVLEKVGMQRYESVSIEDGTGLQYC